MSALVTPRLEPPSVRITYAIAGCSEHSGRYEAANIMIDDPMDQSSRWSGAQHVPGVRQWMLLRLETLAVLSGSWSLDIYSVHLVANTFPVASEHHLWKAHPCNMKEFKIYVGMDEDNMAQILHSSLKNDSAPETFVLGRVNRAGVPFPTRYIRIVPISAYGQSFHTSIWHVSLAGIADEKYVNKIRGDFEEHREANVMLHILKHLRQRRLLTSYQSIISNSSIRLEHPLVTKLHTTLVLQGNWPGTEALLLKLSQAGLFDDYLRTCQPRASWKRITAADPDGDIPCKRGGHAMCIDQGKQKIYLFGGWDGQNSLDDFWVYDIQEDQWTLLSRNSANEKNGPEPRSCHKMVFDAKTGCIFMLGRLGDKDAKEYAEGLDSRHRTSGEDDRTVPFCSEFHRYHTRGLDAGKWDLLSFDTASAGGPPLIFDHQMVMDCDAQVIYVFGGRVVDGDWNSSKYSGLYSYSVRTSKWKMIQPNDAAIPSRFGHSMVLDNSSHMLYIFAGQREEKYLADMYAYNIRTNSAMELFGNFSNNGGPDACFTQRAVLDKELKEIYTFCGLTRTQNLGSLTVLRSDALNWVYRYAETPGQWTEILPPAPSLPPSEGPLPRYAHQVVYDEGTKTVYMHGGNAGLGSGNEQSMERGETSGEQFGENEDERRTRVGEGAGDRRLDDFWSMTLSRPGAKELIRRATFEIRKQQFREMCSGNPQQQVKALNFLRKDIYSTVDHTNPTEAADYRALLTHLLMPTPSTPSRRRSDGEAGTEPPRKRSRPSTPEETWTSDFDTSLEASGSDEERASTPAPSASPASPPRRHVLLRMDEDAEERELRKDGSAVSGDTFRQRTEVFERLMMFIGEGEKQPEGGLVDFMNNIGESW
ncbi:hypothetical protein HWV62_19101 [Athelia sp. TMB]|nr:hypothetical protein HWV62_19101 [Athelia sp. TMB]